MCHLIDANYEGVPSRADWGVLLHLNYEHSSYNCGYNCSTVHPLIAVQRNVFYRKELLGCILHYHTVFTEIPYVLVQTSYYTLIVYAVVSFEWIAAKLFWLYFQTERRAQWGGCVYFLIESSNFDNYWV